MKAIVSVCAIGVAVVAAAMVDPDTAGRSGQVSGRAADKQAKTRLGSDPATSEARDRPIARGGVEVRRSPVNEQGEEAAVVERQPAREQPLDAALIPAVLDGGQLPADEIPTMEKERAPEEHFGEVSPPTVLRGGRLPADEIPATPDEPAPDAPIHEVLPPSALSGGQLPADEIPAVEKESAPEQPVGEAFAPAVLGGGQLPAREIPLIEKEVVTSERAFDEQATDVPADMQAGDFQRGARPLFQHDAEPDVEQTESVRDRIRAAANPRAFALRPPSHVAEKFVTAEVLATTVVQIEFAREAGIDSIAEPDRRVTVEISADLVGALRAEGLEVDIIDRFLQIEISPGESQEESPDEGGEDQGEPGRACTLYVFGSNSTDVSIPDEGYAYSSVSISGYPGLTVCNVAYRVRILHTWPGDIYAQINNSQHSLGSGYTVWDRLGGSDDGGYDDDAENDDDIYLNWRETHFFDGDTVDSTWYLDVWDQAPGDTGNIDYIEFRIYYEDPDQATVYNAWWSNEVDVDGDGCNRSARLNWDPDVEDCDGSLSVFEYIYWKPASSGTWTHLHTTSVHTITDCSVSDAQYVDFNFSAACDAFDWKIEIYRSGESSPDYTRDPSNDSDLNDHLEEVAADDVPDTAVIFSAWWTDEVDVDGDGCNRSARLNWDPDVEDCNGSLSVFEYVYWKPASSGTWTHLYTTSVHTITDCSTSDSQYVDFNFSAACDAFDWKIEIYRSGESSPDYTRDPSNDSDLNDHLEEVAADDVPDTAVISDAWWTNEVDEDSDGCKRSARLNWQPDVADCSGSLSVFEEIYWKPASSGTWTLLETTSVHTITDCSGADAQYVDFGFNSACDAFDWQIEIYRSGEASPDYTRDPSNDADLNDHLEEIAADDVDTALISNAWWTDEVDQDGDGCNRSGRLNWEPDVADCSGSLSVFEEVYWKLASSGTWTLIYTSTEHTITDCSTGDSQYMDFNFNSDCDSFDWRIDIYRSGESSPDYARDPGSDADLNDHQEERQDDDQGLVPDIRVDPAVLSYECTTGPREADSGGDSYEALLAASGSARLSADVLSMVERLGGRILTNLDQRVVWCTFPRHALLDDFEAAGVKVAADAVAAEALLASGDRLIAAVARQFIRTVGPGRQAGASNDPAHPLINDAWPQPPLQMEDYLANLRAVGLDPTNPTVAALIGPRAPDGSFRGNSDDMTGTVAVAVMFVESDGSIDSDDYTWTTAHEDDILAEIDAGLAWWAARATDHGRDVSFDVLSYRHTDARVQQGYEPIQHPSTDGNLWVTEVMDNFGYTDGDHVARVTAFNTWLRGDQATDRAYTAFVCYNPPPAPDQYTDGYAAWAYFGGPYTNLLYRSFGWSFDQVFSHETGHIFWACDEYFQAGFGGCTHCDHCSHGVDNDNCEFCNPNAVDCMMRYNTWDLCAFTPGHVGWGPVSCFTIYNDGTALLTIDPVNKPWWITLIPAPPYNIAAGENLQVCAEVDCGACAGLGLDDTIVLNHNDPDDPPVNVSVHVDCEGCPNPGGSGKYCAADIYPNNGDGLWNYADDGDCVVGISDLAQLLGNYGLASGATRENGDIYPVGSGDGAVNISDLGEMLGQYGDNCN